MKKKALSLMACFCLMAGMISGCGEDSGSTSNDTEYTEDAGMSNDSESGEAVGETEVQPEEAEPAVYYLAKEIGYTDCRNADVDFCVEYEYEYDANGNLIRESHFQHDGFDTATGQFSHSETITEYGYDEAGNVLFEERSHGDNDSKSRIEYEYDAAGNVLFEKNTAMYMYDGEEYADTFIKEYEYEYDTAGNIITITDSSSAAPQTFEYDDAGNMIRAAYDGGGWTEYQYDETGNLIMETGHATADNTDFTKFDGVIFVYEYDTSGNLIREIQNSNAISYSHLGRYLCEREYDASGNLIKEDEYRDGSEQITSSREYEYDEKGRIIKITSTDYVDYDGVFYEEPRITDFTYSYEEEYDDAGNLIRLTTYYHSDMYDYIEYEYAVQ